METEEKLTIKILVQLDINILKSLYDYRALSTDQIMRKHEMSKSYTYRKLFILRNTGLISSNSIRGYLANQSRQGSYYRITEKGINLLREQGFELEKTASDLRVSYQHLPYLLSSNDLLIDLESHGWKMLDSRESKAKYSLNRGDNLHGILISPTGKEYGFYVFMQNVSVTTIARIERELQDYGNISDYMLFAKGEASFNKVVDQYTTSQNGNLVARMQSLKVFPFVFAKYYLRSFYEEANILDYLDNQLKFDFVFKERSDSHIFRQSGLDILVEHEGEEKYFFNLMDTDLKKIYKITQYRKEDYELNGRKILVVTQNKEKHAELLKDIHHVDYLEINVESLINDHLVYQ